VLLTAPGVCKAQGCDRMGILTPTSRIPPVADCIILTCGVIRQRIEIRSPCAYEVNAIVQIQYVLGGRQELRCDKIAFLADYEFTVY
jgi:hypothetical protein